MSNAKPELAEESQNLVSWQDALERKKLAAEISNKIDLAYTNLASEDDDGYRTHLGASVIGEECLRKLYYHWNWFAKESPSDRMERIFLRGHRIEHEMRVILKVCGITYLDQVDETGEQVKVRNESGHYGGGCDGVFKWPEIGITESTLLEIKSSKTGSDFDCLSEKGVRIAKPKHFAQMSTYGYYLNIKHCLYICKNKNNEAIYVELVELDYNIALEMERKAMFIILTNEPPPKISKLPAFWKCRTCDYRGFCHGDEKPERNCRNCVNCKPMSEGKFWCNKHQNFIPKDFLIKGCDQHYFKAF